MQKARLGFSFTQKKSYFSLGIKYITDFCVIKVVDI